MGRMKRETFSWLCFWALAGGVLFAPVAAAAQPTEIAKLRQQIEILRQEVLLLQSLLTNMQTRQPISAASYAAVNLSDNSVLLEKNSPQAYPIASVAKLMTAVIARENIAPSQTITLTEPMLKPLGQSPSLFLGLQVSVENLLKAALIQSANDAAEALAYSMGKETFLDLMNQKARELSMTQTVFYDVHGLNPANRSTASDLAKLVTYIYEKHPEILNITRDNNFWLPDSTGRLLKFQNVNNFYPLSYFLGGKTGYLLEAKQTLAGVFQIQGKPIALVVLSSENRQADVFAILSQLK